MLPRLLTLWEGIRTSLWAVPLLMTCAAMATALAALRVRIGPSTDTVWSLYSGNAAEAPQFLSNLVTAMITMTTLAVSITMIVLTLAAQQLGPRLIRLFMSSHTTQLALGLFISTVVYLVVVLRSVSGTDAVPNLAVTIGTALFLLCLLALFLFLHHLARSIVADNVIEHVGRDLDLNAERLLKADAGPPMDSPAVAADSGVAITLNCQGYIQAIDHASIVSTARAAEAVVKLNVRAGHHVLAGSIIGHVTPADRVNDAFRAELASSLLTGSERTAIQDLEFSIRQMVEIAVRALSPGINDPYTAIVTIHRLTLSLSLIMQMPPPQTQWKDSDGIVRLVAPSSTFQGLLDASFNLIRQYGSGSPAVLISLADNLASLFAMANEKQRADLRVHLEMVRAAGQRSIHERRDLNDLEERLRRALGDAPVSSAGD